MCEVEMRKKKCLYVSTLIVLLFMGQLNVSVKASFASWTVDDDGIADFNTIQEALNAASEGDTILVSSGTYYEHVVVNKSVSLVGEDKDLTIIDGGGEEEDIVYVTADNVDITGFTVRNSEMWAEVAYSCILVDNSHGVNINNNILTNSDYGVLIFDSSNNVVSRNLVYSISWDGITLRSCSNIVVSRNDVSSSENAGITLLECNTVSVSNNIVSNNFYGIYLYSSYNNIIYHNGFINNNQHVDIDGLTNSWDSGYPSGGNYWSDSNVVDLDHDGVGDSPYFIDASNEDNYPIMGMFHSFNTSSGYPVNVVSNSTIEGFEYYESNRTIEMLVANSSATQVFGFCRVCFPQILMAPDKVWAVIDDGQTEIIFTNYILNDNTTHRWIYFAYPQTIHKIIIKEDIIQPTIENISQQPAKDSVYPDDEVEVYAMVTDDLSGVKQVILNYTVNNEAWLTINMQNLEATLYNALIPEFPPDTNITYTIVAIDNVDNIITTKEMGYESKYKVIPEFPSLIVLSFFMIATLLAAVFYKRRLFR